MNKRLSITSLTLLILLFISLIAIGAPRARYTRLFFPQIPPINNQVAALQVFITPESANIEGAAWYIKGIDGYRKSGTRRGSLKPGKITVGFKTIAGYVTPKSQTVKLPNQQLTILTGVYQKQ